MCRQEATQGSHPLKPFATELSGGVRRAHGGREPKVETCLQKDNGSILFNMSRTLWCGGGEKLVYFCQNSSNYMH